MPPSFRYGQLQRRKTNYYMAAMWADYNRLVRFQCVKFVYILYMYVLVSTRVQLPNDFFCYGLITFTKQQHMQ